MVELQDYTVEFTGSIRAQSLSDAYCMLRRIIDNQSLAQTFKIKETKPKQNARVIKIAHPHGGTMIVKVIDEEGKERICEVEENV